MTRPSDEAGRATAVWIAAALALVTIAVKLPTLNTPAWWDEMGYLAQARWLSEVNLARALPGLRPAAAFWGHPPGLHLAAAVPFKLFGASLPLAHLVIAGFAAIGVTGTFLLARHWYGTVTGVSAALALLASPLYLGQAGLFLADLPVTALAVLCAWLAATNRSLAYVVAASCMVMLKETAMAVVVAIAVWRALTGTAAMRARVLDALRHAAPLVVIGSFIALQQLVTGRAFFIFDFEYQSLVVRGPLEVARQAWDITRVLFVEQNRWVLTAAITLALVMHAQSRRRAPLVLVGLVVLLSGYSFSVLSYMPRYVLPALPFVCVLGAASVVALVRSRPGRLLYAGLVPLLLAWANLRPPILDNGEESLAYLRLVRLHATMANVLATRYPDARVLSAWPTATKLSDPFLGYVARPLRVIWYDPAQPLPHAELALVATSGNPQATALRELARERGWPLIVRLSEEGHGVELYRCGPGP